MSINDDKTGSSQPPRESCADRTGTNPFRSPAHSYTASPSSDYTSSVTSQYMPTHAPDSHAPNRSSQSLVQGHGDSSPPEYSPRGSGDSSFRYSDKFVHYGAALAGMATFQDDGRLQITSDEKLPKSLPDSYCAPVDEIGIDVKEFANAPPMDICIMIVGSRGFESVMKGDIGKKQKMIGEILEGCWKSCNEPDDASEGGAPFAADAIISNPPAFAHIHCAEALGIPLLLSFTMPWCATAAFPHPLVNIKQNSTQPNSTNYYSYGLVEIMTWQGLGHTINKFRTKRLGLAALSTVSATSMMERCKIPWTYCLSPALVAKPVDWMAHIDVVGFYFLDLATSYVPPPELEAFLRAGSPPIYIGFGSIVIEDPKEMTLAVLDAIAQTGVRALISPGWGGLDESMIKAAGPNVFALGNVPHDWLFEHVSAVCHHGGAGTTAIGLRCGRPTIIVPFFGDQPWWAAQIARRGAGPAPLPPKQLNKDTLAAAIQMALSPMTREAAQRIGMMIKAENGTKDGVDSFHRHLPLLNMRCDIDPSRLAVWYSPTYKLRLSACAAAILLSTRELDINQLVLNRPREYDTESKAAEPISGVVVPWFQMFNDVGKGLAQLPTSRPDKGMVKLLGAIPKGFHGSLKGTQEGLQALPKYYGSETRETGKVTDVGSGFKEGGKGFAMGFYDGVSDFFVEPVRGYKKSGVVGALAGTGRGSVNLLLKPTAGAFASVTLPIEGSIRAIRGMRHQGAGKEKRLLRLQQGTIEAEGCSREKRDSVVRTRMSIKVREGKDYCNVIASGVGNARNQSEMQINVK
ncbi:UDP-Glycosyltransferase/glycogen phosphorylase [Ceratobasidium sp. AG-I]|nr:UDP-Glycosyltransferase/glycogen phosphorylase [Ceratobasidium sp. AG-I]